MLEGKALTALYEDLHAHPELSNQEIRTAGIAADHLRAQGWEVTEGVGGTGVVGVLRNSSGPTVLLRADMDALPVQEQTGLPYASNVMATDPRGQDVPVMHACGHDLHVSCLLSAAGRLASTREGWHGTVLSVFQPAEELGSGAQAMIDDGLFDRFGKPDVVLGQHVSPLPAGVIGVRPGPTFAGSDSMRITMYGRGGHGSRPEICVDPVVMAAATVLRLQGVVSREIAGSDTAVLTVGALNAGAKENVIPDEAELLVNLRSYTPAVRARLIDAVTRIVQSEAAASGAPAPPRIEMGASYPPLVNDPSATERTLPALRSAASFVVDPGPITASEDVGAFAAAAGSPVVYWLIGGSDPAIFEGLTAVEDLSVRVAEQPSNHSSQYAPVPDPTLRMGTDALVAAAREWLGSEDSTGDAGIVQHES